MVCVDNRTAIEKWRSVHRARDVSQGVPYLTIRALERYAVPILCNHYGLQTGIFAAVRCA